MQMYIHIVKNMKMWKTRLKASEILYKFRNKTYLQEK